MSEVDCTMLLIKEKVFIKEINTGKMNKALTNLYKFKEIVECAYDFKKEV